MESLYEQKIKFVQLKKNMYTECSKNYLEELKACSRRIIARVIPTEFRDAATSRVETFIDKVFDQLLKQVDYGFREKMCFLLFQKGLKNANTIGLPLEINIFGKMLNDAYEFFPRYPEGKNQARRRVFGKVSRMELQEFHRF